jgi:hypothetical protein
LRVCYSLQHLTQTALLFQAASLAFTHSALNVITLNPVNVRLTSSHSITNAAHEDEDEDTVELMRFFEQEMDADQSEAQFVQPWRSGEEDDTARTRTLGRVHHQLLGDWRLMIFATDYSQRHGRGMDPSG